MAAFKKFLDSCPPQLGSVTELLPFYALPYVPEPEDNAVFAAVFQVTWIRSLRSRLGAWLNESLAPPPALVTLNRKANRSAGSVGAAMGANGDAAEARRSHRTLRRRLLRLQDDYHRLLGVAMELTRALEQSVAGAAVDLESTLAACTHRHPDLFTQALADVQVAPTSILLETMQRSRLLSVSSCCVTALDYDRVRRTLTEGTEQEVVLLLQALRQRVTRTTHGMARQAVLTAVVRNDLLGITAPPVLTSEAPGAGGRTKADDGGVELPEAVGSRCWQRLSAALRSDEPHPLGQSVARLLSTLSSFRLGRSYLAKLPAVSSALLEVLMQELGDPVTQDLCLAALQKLSVRGDVQEQLVAGGCVQWVSRALREGAGTLSLSSEECCAALLLNLSLRSRARLAAAPVADSLLPTLTKLLADRKPALVSYIMGSLYSLISEPLLRHEALSLRLDSAIARLAQSEEDENYKKQLQYLVVQIRREVNPTPPASPPPSPHHLQEEPEFLEEELELGDPVRARAGDLQGEDLLTARYSLSRPTDDYGDMETSGTRSAPAMYRREVVTPSLSWRLPTRPHSDAFHPRHLHSATLPGHYSRWTPSAGSFHWGYPADPNHRRPSLSLQYGTINRTDAWSSTDNSMVQPQLQPTYHRDSQSGTEGSPLPPAFSVYTQPYHRPPHLQPTTPPFAASNSYSPPISEEVEYLPSSSEGLSANTRPPTSSLRRGAAPSPPQQGQRQHYQQHQAREHYQEDEEEQMYLRAQQQRQREQDEELVRPYQQQGQGYRQQQQQQEDDSYPQPSYEQQHGSYRSQQQQGAYRRQVSPEEQQQQQRQREYDYQQQPRAPVTEEQHEQHEYEDETESQREYERQRLVWQQQQQLQKKEEQHRLRYSPEQHQQEYFERQRTLDPLNDYPEHDRIAYSSEDEAGQQYEPRYRETAVGHAEDERYDAGPHRGGYKQLGKNSPEPVALGEPHVQDPDPTSEAMSAPSPEGEAVRRPHSPEESSNYPAKEYPVDDAAPSPSGEGSGTAGQSERRGITSAAGSRLTRRPSVVLERAIVHHQDATAPDLREVVYSLQTRHGIGRVSLESDPLVRSLPPPKAKEYVAIFSSRPRVTRTPPDSAAEGRTTPTAHATAPPDTPRRVLPPISKTNRSYSRGMI